MSLDDNSLNEYRIVPVQIINIVKRCGKTNYVLNKPDLDLILAKVGDRKFALIFNVGIQGEGNSFLLNKIGRYIINCVKNHDQLLSIDGQDVDYDMGTEIEVLEDPDDPLVGFEWNSDPNETTTRGIWFSQPFIVHKTGGEELAIILVDTQGLFDDESTQRDMSTIVGLSLLSASTLVFNVKRLKDDVLTIMHSFLDYGLQAVASVVADDADDEHRCDDIKPFQNLVFMIRDWSRPDSPTEYGLIGGQYFLNNRLKINERQCDAARNARQIIRKCFDNIDCYLMPDPGLVAQRSTFHGCDNELNTEFKDKVNEFCRYLVNPDTIKVKEINGQPITGQEFGHYFEAYVNMFNSESMPEACDLIEATHRAHDINLINKLKDEYTAGMEALMNGDLFIGRHQFAINSIDLCNGLQSKFASRKRSIAESVIRELTDQLSLTLETVLSQKKEENENKRLTQTNNKVTELVNEFKENIDSHITREKCLTEDNLNTIIRAIREHVINIFNIFAAIDVTLFTETKNTFLTDLERLENVYKCNNSQEIQKISTKYDSFTSYLNTQYDQKMGELFFEHDKFYVKEHLDTLSGAILNELVIQLIQTDEGINVVSIQPYIQALHIHEFHRIATYREINQIRTDSTMSTVVENLKQQYESELAAWIDVTITEDRDRFKEASRRIRSHIVTENTLRYQHRLNLVQLCSQLDITEREMLDVFIGEVGVRSRANAAIIDQVLKWYNQRVKTEYGLQTYIRPDKLAKIHEGLVKAAVARFKGESPHLKPEAFADLIKKNLNIAYTHVTNQNNSNAPTVPAIGIDLGTTNSCVAYYRPGKSGETGHIQVCRNINMEVTPSCVEYKDNGEVVVGEEAKDNLLGSRRQIIYSAKRMIGRQFDDPKITEYSENWPFNVIDIEGAAGVEVEVDSESCQKLPEEVSADVLRKMKEIAERDLGHPVLDAVITVPAYFNDAQRLSTINAGIMAGLNVLSIINEPTAAALAFKLDRFDDSNARTVLVYDFGGGTFDVAILRLSMGSVEVLAVGGATDLGGDDLDQKIIDYCFSEFYLKTGVEIDQQSNEGERAKRALKDRCEREKWRLSEMTVATIAVDKIIDNLDLAIELTREKFEEINMSIFERTMNCVTTTMAKVNGGAGIKPEEIDDIILVGGSTYIPKVKTMITEYFNGREPSHSVNPMLAVAEGAALKAAILNGNEAYLNKYLQVREVTPHTLGVREHGNWMSPIIPAQSRVDGIPRTRVYTTVSDHQTEIEVEVYEGEDPVATNNTLLKQYVVTGIPPQTVGSQNVSIEFCINDDGVLKVKAKVLSQGTEQEMEVTEYKGRLSTDELIIQRHHL